MAQLVNILKQLRSSSKVSQKGNIWEEFYGNRKSVLSAASIGPFPHLYRRYDRGLAIAFYKQNGRNVQPRMTKLSFLGENK
jgi:hypothetical protein